MYFQQIQSGGFPRYEAYPLLQGLNLSIGSPEVPAGSGKLLLEIRHFISCGEVAPGFILNINKKFC